MYSLLACLSILSAVFQTAMAAPCGAESPTPITPTPQDIYSSPMDRFYAHAGKGIHQFATTHLHPHLRGLKSVFYPFGGGDILYPLFLVPDLETLVLVGMEPVGPLPERVSASDLGPVESLIRRGFFVTGEMTKAFKAEGGILTAILTQLFLLKAEVKSIERIYGLLTGVRVAFVYQGRVRQIFYFQADLSDEGLSPLLLATVRLNRWIDLTLFKATSYMPHHQRFSKIGKFVRENTTALLQDDSGIPIHQVKNTFKTIRLYGGYVEPYGEEFKGHRQPKLAALYEGSRTPPRKLPFCFGYGCHIIPTPLILATKVAPSFLVSPSSQPSAGSSASPSE